ncbi:MAG: UTP--glucose-1-phosphate uridylyltransferase [Patescibacteria group bacterium]
MTQKRVSKLIIPIAGWGTRFLPATKALPKEMLPIVDKPILQYIVEEAVASGITDIIFVTNQNKRAAEDHFDTNRELEQWLTQKKKTQELQQLKKISSLAHFVYLRQRGPYGNGTPVLNARHLIGEEPFAVVWGDDLFIGPTPHLKQLMKVYETYTDPVITAYPTDSAGTKRYGIIEGIKIEPHVYQVRTVVEKPGPRTTRSRLASHGGYILTPDIFPILARTKPGRGGEIWLVDALMALAQRRPVYACLIEGAYYDLGSTLGWVKANIDFALQRKEFKQPLSRFLKSRMAANVKPKSQNPK